MPHEHHDGCGHESHDHDHEHDHGDASLGYQDNLYQHIDRPNVIALNNADGTAASEIIKPWHLRLDETKYIESDADDQLIIRVPFTGTVRLKAILLKAGPAGHTPSTILLFPNEPTLDFNDIQDRKPVQELPVPQNREVGEYAVKTAKFSNISDITLFIPSSQGEDTTRIYYLGFLGTWTESKSQPIITVYEAQANLADHEKIQGTDAMWSRPGH